MMKLETAIARCFDRCNLDESGEGMDIYHHMFKYKAIADLYYTDPDKFEEIYDQISKGLGFQQPCCF